MVKPVNKTLRIAAMSAGEEIGHVSGSVVTFRGNGDPLRSLIVNIDPVQDLHGYDNPWPAGGGKNKWNDADATCSNLSRDGTKYTNTATDTRTYGVILVQLYNGDTLVANSSSVSASAVGRYSITFTNTETITNIRLKHSGITQDFRIDFPFTGTGTYTISWTSLGVDPQTVGGFVIENIQLESGSQMTNYSPYSNICPISGWSEVNVGVKPTYDPTANPTATIQLGQTVYGGTLDVTNGVLTVDRAMVIATSCESVSTASTGIKYATVPLTITAKPEASSNQNFSSEYKYRINAPSSDGWFRMVANTLYVFDNRFTDKATADNILFAEQPEFVYELATPITIPLTPQEISTLQGTNNLWADSGDVDVEYIATGGEGGKLALLLRNRKELLIALRKGLSPAEAGLLSSTPLLGGFVRPGLSTDDEKEEEELW